MIYTTYLKPTLDKMIALVLLALCSPLFFILFICVKMDSKGPFLFVQKRIGKNGKPFLIYKIRSMIYSPHSEGNYFTHTNDVRITKVGNFIRKTSLDELPQLLNLFKGDMSLIGVRPDTPYQESDYSAESWKYRHEQTPGITGLAQSTLRSSATPRRRLQYDLFYVQHISFSLDIIIVYRTLKTLFKKGMQN